MIGTFAAVATPALAENAQQERMKSCNTKAGDKKGDERKAFMKDCLSTEKKAYDSKMGACNTKSKGMKGDERKKFMSECMKAA
jgi:psiF repeat-containing protein